VACDVELGPLAKTFALTGGHIKEVILRAASRAFATGRPITQQDLLLSANAEYRKLGLLSPHLEVHE
jgi:hypothetical protein